MKRDDEPDSMGSGSSLKYKKAIKEISRLISINTATKKQIVALQQRYDRLSTEHENLQEKYSTVQFELSNLKQKIATEPHAHRHDLEGKSLENTDNISNYAETVRKLEQLEELLQQREKAIQQLEQSIQQKDRLNIELSGQCSTLKQEVLQLKVSKQSNIYDDLIKEKCFLEERLKKSQELTKKISQDYEILRQKLVFSDNLGIKNSRRESRDHQKQHGGQPALQRVHKLQRMLQVTKQRSRERKEKLKGQIRELKHDNLEKCEKIKNLASFIEKQQIFIEKFVMNSNDK